MASLLKFFGRSKGGVTSVEFIELKIRFFHKRMSHYKLLEMQQITTHCDLVQPKEPKATLPFIWSQVLGF